MGQRRLFEDKYFVRLQCDLVVIKRRIFILLIFIILFSIDLLSIYYKLDILRYVGNIMMGKQLFFCLFVYVIVYLFSLQFSGVENN